jgi:hypothetical protein
MNASTLTAIVNDLSADGWHGIDSRESDPDVPIVHALQRYRVKANDRAMAAVRVALNERRPTPEPVQDLGLPAPTAEELAEEAAWFTDMFFMFELTFPRSAVWTVGDAVHVKSLKPLSHAIRQTAFRAGMTVAAAHGVPDSPPTMRQVVNALIQRLAREGRLTR